MICELYERMENFCDDIGDHNHINLYNRNEDNHVYYTTRSEFLQMSIKFCWNVFMTVLYLVLVAWWIPWFDRHIYRE